MKKWLCNPIPAGNSEMRREFGDFLGELLLSRGIYDMQRARDFFACDSLSDPYLLRDMDKAVDKIREALDEGRYEEFYNKYRNILGERSVN